MSFTPAIRFAYSRCEFTKTIRPNSIGGNNKSAQYIGGAIVVFLIGKADKICRMNF
jgi:hypothetical protein